MRTVQTSPKERTWPSANGCVPAAMTHSDTTPQRLIRFCTHAHSCHCGLKLIRPYLMAPRSLKQFIRRNANEHRARSLVVQGARRKRPRSHSNCDWCICRRQSPVHRVYDTDRDSRSLERSAITRQVFAEQMNAIALRCPRGRPLPRRTTLFCRRFFQKHDKTRPLGKLNAQLEKQEFYFVGPFNPPVSK